MSLINDGDIDKVDEKGEEQKVQDNEENAQEVDESNPLEKAIQHSLNNNAIL